MFAHTHVDLKPDATVVLDVRKPHAMGLRFGTVLSITVDPADPKAAADKCQQVADLWHTLAVRFDELAQGGAA